MLLFFVDISPHAVVELQGCVVIARNCIRAQDDKHTLTPTFTGIIFNTRMVMAPEGVFDKSSDNSLETFTSYQK